MTGRWVDEWSLDADNFQGKRFVRRVSHVEHGTEEYLVSVCDTSAAARRRVSPYSEGVSL